MNRTFQNSAILLIDRDLKSSTEWQASLRESFGVVETSTSLAAAVELLERSNFTFIVCELELIEMSLPLCALATALLAQNCPIIFQAAHQPAAVKFQRFSGQSFYCLKKSVGSDLIPVIASLASRVIPAIPQTPRFANTPHFVLPMAMDNPAVNSNIHSMY